jgi:hypothetical protein
MLLPIGVTPYYGDDIFNSYINGAIASAHAPFWTFFQDLNANWMRAGRFFPGALIESYGLFHILPELAPYKAFQILITLLNVVTFYFVLRELRMSRAASLMAVVVLVASFQIRAYHDGLLGFSGNIEFITEVALIGTLGLLIFARSGNRWWYAAAIAIYAAGLVTYEATYLYWIIFVAVLLLRLPVRRALVAAAPFVLMSAATILAQLYVKSSAHTQADADYNLRFNLGDLTRTFFEQAIAAVPTSYLVIDPANLYGHGFALFAHVPVWIGIAIFALVTGTVWMLSGAFDRAAVPDKRTILTLVITGLVLWLTPALLVASSARYQRELTFGLGHVPVYIEYFGVTLLIIAIGALAVGRLGVPGRNARVTLAVILGVIATSTYASNAVVIAMTAPDKEGLLNISAALRAGLLDGVPSKADLYLDQAISANRYLDGSGADAKYFYILHAGKPIEAHSIGSLASGCGTSCKAPKNAYELLNVPAGEYAGFDALGHLDTIAQKNGLVESDASAVLLFVRGLGPNSSLTLSYEERGCADGDRTATETLLGGPGGIISVGLPTACRSIAMNTITLEDPLASGTADAR